MSNALIQCCFGRMIRVVVTIGLLLPCVSCDGLLSAGNIAINPDGSEGQLCSGSFYTGEGFELCRRNADGALGAFEIFINHLQVTSQGTVVLAGTLPIGIAEITQEFRGIGYDSEGNEVTYADIFWTLKANDGNLLTLSQIDGLPEVQNALGSDPQVDSAVAFIENFVLHYHLQYNLIVADEANTFYGIDGFFGCAAIRPEQREAVCFTLYDLDGNGTFTGDDYVDLIAIVEGPEEAESIIIDDFSLGQYYACSEADFNTDEDGLITPDCRSLDKNNDGIVDERDLRLLFDAGEESTGDNTPPVAYAGLDQTVVAGETVSLQGGESYDLETEFQNLTFLWEQTAGTTVTITNAQQSTADFVAPQVTVNTTFKFQITVVDADGLTDSDVVEITVQPEGPVANAGQDQTIESQERITLDGSQSTGNEITYSWTQTGGTNVTLSSATTAKPTFDAPLVESATVLSFQLVVTDDNGLVDADSVDITILPPSEEAVEADAGSDQQYTAGTLITLDGSESTGDELTFLWTQTEGPTVTLVTSTVAKPVFETTQLTITSPTVLTFRLTVTDNQDNSDSDDVVITLLPAEEEGG